MPRKRVIISRVREPETIGALVRQPQFIALTIIAIISICFLLFISISGYWPIYCDHLHIATFGLVGVTYTAAITSFSLLLSWILVDDCTWFLKSCFLFTCSILYLACGTYYFYVYFHGHMCGGSSFGDPNPTESPEEHDCHSETTEEEVEAWVPTMFCICIAKGVIYFLFAIYIIISLDD